MNIQTIELGREIAIILLSLGYNLKNSKNTIFKADVDKYFYISTNNQWRRIDLNLINHNATFTIVDDNNVSKFVRDNIMNILGKSL